MPDSPKLVKFATFEMDLHAGELKRQGVRIPFQSQPFKILEILVLRAGEVVPREELYAQLSSQGEYDYKQRLNNAILKIRAALGDASTNSRFIETVAGRGYRFLLPVKIVSNGLVKGYREFPATDLFLDAVSQIYQELFCTFGAELNELLYRAHDLIDQHPEHPQKHKARRLVDQIQEAINAPCSSEANARRHRVSFEAAYQVFDDPNAVSLHEGSGIWRTVGQAGRGIGPFRQHVLVTASHYVLTGKNGQEQVMIRSARKATERERKMYEQNKNKTDE